MKVDGITLLQMIKDGKVKDGTKIYCDRFHEYSGIYIIYEDKELNIYDRRGRYDEENKFGVISSTDLLDYEFEIEIIEEEKKIELPEKLEIEQDKPNSNYYIKNEFGTKCGLTKHSKMIADKLNETLDYLKYKEEESKK